MLKNKNIFILILILISVLTFILSFYSDWINNNYSLILNIQFIVLLIGIFILKIMDSKEK